jgi:pimeloyl-ACP methyl ester carboxylesterase
LAEIHLLSECPAQVASHAIFFHGLDGHPRHSWGVPTDPEACWPAWLSDDIANLAIWSVGYPAASSRWRGTAMHIVDRAPNILELLLLEPKLAQGDITLIGHSMGGLIIKQLLRTAHSMAQHRPNVDGFLRRVRRVAFVATPHAGADLGTWTSRLRIFVRPTAATGCLVRNDANLRDLNHWYRDWVNAGAISHLILVESQPLRIGGWIVKPDSADPGLGERPVLLDADHISICKAADRNSEIYRHIKAFIERSATPSTPLTSVQIALERQEASLGNLATSLRETEGRLDETLSSLGTSIAKQGERTANLVVERLAESISSAASSGRATRSDLIDREIDNQLQILRRARFFNGFEAANTAHRLGTKLIDGDLSGGSDTTRGIALAWCSRFLAVDEHIDMARNFLTRARQLVDAEEIVIAESFIKRQEGDNNGALQELGTLATPLRRTAALFVAVRNRAPDAFLEWFSQVGWTADTLDADGKVLLLGQLLAAQRWDEAFVMVSSLRNGDYDDAPCLRYLAANAHLVKAVPEEFKEALLQHVPFEADAFPLASDEAGMANRHSAERLYEECRISAAILGVRMAQNLCSDFALWLRLRDPSKRADARGELEASMRDSEHSLRRSFLALRFGIKLDSHAIESEIQRHEALGIANSPDVAMARLTVAFLQSDPKAAAAYIARYRELLYAQLQRPAIGCLEVQLLAQAGELQQAEQVYKALVEHGLDEIQQSRLQKVMAVSSGSNSVDIGKKLFATTGSLTDLVNLVANLEDAQDWAQLCVYGAELFQRTRALADAERIASAYNSTRRFGDLHQLLQAHADLRAQSSLLAALWCWTLYREGRFNEASAALKPLLVNATVSGLNALQISLIVASGRWDDLHQYTEDEWRHRQDRTAAELLNAAQLGCIIKAPHAKELIHAAAEKGGDDANILVKAYFLATSAGIEGDARVVEWLLNAQTLSGENGPLRKMSLKEIAESKPEWDRQANETWRKVAEGGLPLFAAGRLLNRSLIDMMLLSHVGNIGEPDVRRRALISSISGARAVDQRYDVKTIALDATALLTLGALRLLPKLAKGMARLVIPHATLGWLFEECQKATFHQPSRIKKAHILRGLLSTGAIQKFTPQRQGDTKLVEEVGEELAQFLTEVAYQRTCGEKKSYVIRSSPVHRIGSLMDEEADLSDHQSILCSCMAIVDKLKECGQLTASEETKARSYLRLQERDWPMQPSIENNAHLFLDDLSVTYLQHIGLLDKLRNAHLTAYVSQHTVNEVNSLLSYEQLVTEVVEIIDDIRAFLAAGLHTGAIVAAPVPEQRNDDADEEGDDGDDRFRHHPSMAILLDAERVDAVVVDDRFMNQHQRVATKTKEVPVLSTVDIIDILRDRDVLTGNERLEARMALRRAGHFVVPILQDELTHYLTAAKIHDGLLIESAELRMLREYLLQIRMRPFLKLPGEAPWLISFMQAFQGAIKDQWKVGNSPEIAATRSDWLIEQLDVRGWTQFYLGSSEPNIVQQALESQIMLLVIFAIDMSGNMHAAYVAWLERRILKKVKDEMPELYASLIEQIKQLISDTIARANGGGDA